MVLQGQSAASDNLYRSRKTRVSSDGAQRQLTPLEFLPRTERDIVLALKLFGPANIVDLSEKLNASASALRPHLGSLESGGMVTHRPEIRGPGRPQHLFSLTADADSLFPNAVSEFGVALVQFLASADPVLLETFVAGVQSQFRERARQLLGDATHEERLDAVIEALRDIDYLPERTDAAEFVEMKLHHCPLASVARNFPLMCEYERESFEEIVPGAHVTRTAWRFDSTPFCSFEFRRKSEDEEAGEASPTPGLRLINLDEFEAEPEAADEPHALLF